MADHDELKVNCTGTRYHAAGSPEAESVVARLAAFRAADPPPPPPEQRPRQQSLLTPTQKKAIRWAESKAPKTGPQPWPPGTPFVHAVILYRSGIFRVQRLPAERCKSRWWNCIEAVHLTREEACKAALALADDAVAARRKNIDHQIKALARDERNALLTRVWLPEGTRHGKI